MSKYKGVFGRFTTKLNSYLTSRLDLIFFYISSARDFGKTKTRHTCSITNSPVFFYYKHGANRTLRQCLFHRDTRPGRYDRCNEPSYYARRGQWGRPSVPEVRRRRTKRPTVPTPSVGDSTPVRVV